MPIWSSARRLAIGDTRDPPPCVVLRPPPCTEAAAAFPGFRQDEVPAVMIDRRVITVVLLAAAVGVFVGLGGWSFVNDGERVEEFFTERGRGSGRSCSWF